MSFEVSSCGWSQEQVHSSLNLVNYSIQCLIPRLKRHNPPFVQAMLELGINKPLGT